MPPGAGWLVRGGSVVARAGGFRRSGRVAEQRTGEAVRSAAATGEFGAGEGQHLDAGTPQASVGGVVAVVGDDESGAQRQYVRGVTPLFPAYGETVVAGVHDPQGRQLEGVGECRETVVRRACADLAA